MDFSVKGFLILIICVEGMVCKSLSQTSQQEDDTRLSLVRLFRIRRFDYSMFGCGCYTTTPQCLSDSECRQSHGDGFSCNFKCCRLMCVQRDDDNDESASSYHRRFWNFNPYHRQYDHQTGDHPADSEDERLPIDNIVNNVDIDLTKSHDTESTQTVKPFRTDDLITTQQSKDAYIIKRQEMTSLQPKKFTTQQQTTKTMSQHLD